jgi:hypothetical protein
MMFMVTVQTSATREVAGGELVLRRPDGASPWEISMFRRSGFVGGPTLLQTAELNAHHYQGMTFATPEEAVTFIEELLAA